MVVSRYISLSARHKTTIPNFNTEFDTLETSPSENLQKLVRNEGQYSTEKGYKMDRNHREILVQHFVLGERQQIANDFKESSQLKY